MSNKNFSNAASQVSTSNISNVKDNNFVNADGAYSSFFVKYLEETYRQIKSKPFSTLKWLQYLDQDTLDMLCGYTDNFNEKKPLDEIDEEESIDIFRLVESLIKIETYGTLTRGYINPDSIDFEKCVQCFCLMAIMEGICRKGLAKAVGDGKLINNQTTYNLTELGETIRNFL